MIRTSRLLLVLAVALGSLAATPSRAQRPKVVPGPQADTGGQSVAPEPKTTGAPVTLGGDTLFLLRAQFGAFTAKERADAVTLRLATLAPRIGSGADSVTVIDAGGRTELAVGHQVLMTVLDDDAGATGGSRLAIAKRYASIITDQSRVFAKGHGARAYLWGAGYMALVLIVLLLILRSMIWLFRRVYGRISTQSGRIPSLRIQRMELLSANSIATILTLLARLVRTLLTLLIIYAALSLILSFFPSTAGYARKIVGYAIDRVAQAARSLVAYLPDAFSIVVIVVIARYLIKLLRSIFAALGNGTITMQGFYRDWATPTYKLSRTLVLVFAAVVIFPHLPGSSSDAFKGRSVFLGILVWLGSSGAVSNMVAAVVLTYTRAFQIGDRVQIGERSAT